MTPTERDEEMRALRAERDALLAQLTKVDEALAELSARAVVMSVAPPLPIVLDAEPAATVAVEEGLESSHALPGDVVPTVVKSARVLSAAHRRALVEGKRRARHAVEAAAGRAREALGPSRGLTSTSAEKPRLVKRRTP